LLDMSLHMDTDSESTSLCSFFKVTCLY